MKLLKIGRSQKIGLLICLSAEALLRRKKLKKKKISDEQVAANSHQKCDYQIFINRIKYLCFCIIDFLNVLRKSYKMLVKPHILFLFPNLFNKCIKT